jgi:hypothetical protein
MKGIVDRIEDGKIAVIHISGGGDMKIPVEHFNFALHEGAHLDIQFTPNKADEERTVEEISNIKDKLLGHDENDK